MARKSLLPFEQFLRAIERDEVAPVYAFLGPEAYFHDRGIAAVRARLEAMAPDDLDLVYYDGQEDEATGKPPVISAILDDIRMSSLFGGRRMVILRNGSALLVAHGELLERALASLKTENVLVCAAASLRANSKAFKALAQSGVMVECEAPYASPPPWKPNAPPHDTPLAQWIAARGRELGLKIGLPEARLLYDISGTSLNELMNELEKILQSQGPGVVTTDTIEQLAARSGEGSSFVLAEAMGVRDLPRALELLRRLFEGGVQLEGRQVQDPGVIAGFLVSALHRTFVQIARGHGIVRAGGSEDELTRELGVRSPFLPRLRQQMQRWSAPAAQAVLRRLFELDRKLKSGARQRPDEILEEGLVAMAGEPVGRQS